ncbi:MAG: hypothetical protein ABIR80_04195 [Opitutaceae bacterium]
MKPGLILAAAAFAVSLAAQTQPPADWWKPTSNPAATYSPRIART